MPLAISFLVILLRQLQTLFDQSNVGLPGRNSMRRFFLKRVQDIDGIRKANGIERPVGVSVMVFNDLQNSRPFALPRFRRRMLSAVLSRAESETGSALNLGWKSRDVLE
jgi:hypothetical protein